MTCCFKYILPIYIYIYFPPFLYLTIFHLQIKQASLGIHGIHVQFIGINFLESLVCGVFAILYSFGAWYLNGLFCWLSPLGLLFLSPQVSEFSPSTSSAMGLPREFHEQCRRSLELDYLKACVTVYTTFLMLTANEAACIEWLAIQTFSCKSCIML